jgi:hypothetical protein
LGAEAGGRRTAPGRRGGRAEGRSAVIALIGV